MRRNKITDTDVFEEVKEVKKEMYEKIRKMGREN
jgi:hypothetical protein